MPEGPHFHKRRELMVDDTLQLKLPIKVVSWIYVYALAFGLLLSAPSIYEFITAPAGGREALEAQQLLVNAVRYAVLPLGLLFLLTLHGMVMMHRIAGPVFRFRAVMKQLAAGQDPGVVRLREKDQLKDLAESMNQALEALRADAARQQRMSLQIREASNKLVAAAVNPDLDPTAVPDLAHALHEQVEHLDRHLAERWGSVSGSVDQIVDMVAEPEFAQ